MAHTSAKVSPAILAVFLANLGIAIAKFLGFAITGATSLLAEGAHSLADTGNQALLILGGRRAQREADDAHPFGYGGERYFWAFVVTVVLFTAGSFFALYEGIERLLHPHHLESAEWAIGILLVAIGLETFSLRTAVREAREPKARDGGTWWAFIKRSKSPELPVVLLEDTGALAGLVIALIGVVTAELTGNARWDAAGSLAIGVLLFAIALVLSVEMKSLLLGEAASASQLDALQDAVVSTDSVRRLIHLRTRHLGPDDLLVAGKIELDPTLDYEQISRAIDAIEVRMRAAVPAAKLIFLEPDSYRDPQTPPNPSTS